MARFCSLDHDQTLCSRVLEPQLLRTTVSAAGIGIGEVQCSVVAVLGHCSMAQPQKRVPYALRGSHAGTGNALSRAPDHRLLRAALHREP